jgi:hypothetical protein
MSAAVRGSCTYSEVVTFPVPTTRAPPRPSIDMGIPPNPIADPVIVPRTRVFMSRWPTDGPSGATYVDVHGRVT